MPQYARKDGRFCVTYTTGPSHVWLGLSFAAAPGPIIVVKYPAIGSCEHGALDEGRLVEVVQEGVSDAVMDTRVHLAIQELAYVANDTHSYHLYRRCGYLIAKRVATGESFEP